MSRQQCRREKAVTNIQPRGPTLLWSWSWRF